MVYSKLFHGSCLLLGLILNLSVLAGELALTETERQWLADHPVVRIAPDPDSPPYEWLADDGSYRGIALSQEIPADETTAEIIRDIDDAVRRADTVIHGRTQNHEIRKAFLPVASDLESTPAAKQARALSA